MRRAAVAKKKITRTKLEPSKADVLLVNDAQFLPVLETLIQNAQTSV